MPYDRRSIDHPAWCSPSCCTAPAEQPRTLAETPRGAAHSSALVELPVPPGACALLPTDGPFTAHLFEAIAPWRCYTFLAISLGDRRLIQLQAVDAADALAALVNLLRPAIAERFHEFPALPVPAPVLFPELLDRVAYAATRCGASVAAWNAVHKAMGSDLNDDNSRVRVTPRSGDEVVGRVVRITDTGFEIQGAPAPFEWPAVLAVTPA